MAGLVYDQPLCSLLGIKQDPDICVKCVFREHELLLRSFSSICSTPFGSFLDFAHQVIACWLEDCCYVHLLCCSDGITDTPYVTSIMMLGFLLCCLQGCLAAVHQFFIRVDSRDLGIRGINWQGCKWCSVCFMFGKTFQCWDMFSHWETAAQHDPVKVEYKFSWMVSCFPVAEPFAVGTLGLCQL